MVMGLGRGLVPLPGDSSWLATGVDFKFMKLIVAASVPLLGAVISLPFGVIISLFWLVSLHGPRFSASACGGLTPEKRGRAVLWSTGPAAQGDLGSGFNSCSQAQVSREEEMSILTGIPRSLKLYRELETKIKVQEPKTGYKESKRLLEDSKCKKFHTLHKYKIRIKISG
ncbi:hypothetical protein DSO57_1035715 [Entomophthora muscae]|uniref:Uncharacterized protein n=1 Tax=Entomophthora muscae TaxID=34485 RepID=A0ACC2S1Q2_9FUNG|nr:hypothetical protein DSO57_1035715 [Entomophthora muscae]